MVLHPSSIDRTRTSQDPVVDTISTGTRVDFEKWGLNTLKATGTVVKEVSSVVTGSLANVQRLAAWFGEGIAWTLGHAKGATDRWSEKYRSAYVEGKGKVNMKHND